MRAEVEHVVPPAGRLWLLYTRADTAFEFWWHAHEHYELTFVERGSGRRFAGDSVASYAPGDLALFGPNLPHTYVSDRRDGPSIAHVAQFRFADFRPLLDHDEFRQVRDMLQAAHGGLALAAEPAWLRRSVAALLRRDGARQTLALLEFLVALSAGAERMPLAAAPALRAARPGTDAALSAAVRFVEHNYRSALSRERVADAVSLAPSSLSRLFRRELGRTLTDYIVEVRLSAAADRLATTSEPVAWIAWESGFANLASFNRQFRRRYAMPPTRYRRQFAPAAAGQPRE